ncbi:MAG: Zn-dependent hydrolase [Alkalinema sp. RU_4_3]|nr:Zn-dependent hydrolase [Alkalinema sp. RU_4_3]
MTTSNPLQINGDRLRQSLDDLAQIGQLENGGICRLAFSTEDIQARAWVRSQMETAGMTVRIDAAGNLIGHSPGQEDLPVLATGSHIDTVPVGGKYDGCLGVLAGIEVVRTLREHHCHLRHPIEVIVFSDEERSVIGSKAMAGELSADPHLYVRLDGTPIQTCLAQVGGDWDQIHQARRSGQIAAFLELHVEQGGVLEATGTEIGIVTGVVGQYRFAVRIIGQPNHAGSTPMNDRQDALVAASYLVVAVNHLAVTTPGEQVATVGHLTVSPNATNTIPGQVDLHIDLRDISASHLQRLIGQIKLDCDRIAQATNTTITLDPFLEIRPTLADRRIMNVIAQVCQQQQLSHCELPSRAGHDAQEIGRIAPMGMIFVPSRSGISHSEQEFTSLEQCIQGTNVLLHSLIRLDA